MHELENMCCTFSQATSFNKSGLGVAPIPLFVYKIDLRGEASTVQLLPSSVPSLANVDDNILLYPAYTVADLGAMLQKEIKDCFFHNPSGMWSHHHTMWEGGARQDLFATQAECYADILLYHMHRHPDKYTPELLNNRLQKFYSLERML